MHIVFIKNYDIYKAGKEYTLERTLGARMCEMGVAVVYTDWVNMESEKAADKKAKALKAKEDAKRKTATSKKAFRRSKAVK